MALMGTFHAPDLRLAVAASKSNILIIVAGVVNAVGRVIEIEGHTTGRVGSIA